MKFGEEQVIFFDICRKCKLVSDWDLELFFFESLLKISFLIALFNK